MAPLWAYCLGEKAGSFQSFAPTYLGWGYCQATNHHERSRNFHIPFRTGLVPCPVSLAPFTARCGGAPSPDTSILLRITQLLFDTSIFKESRKRLCPCSRVHRMSHIRICTVMESGHTRSPGDDIGHSHLRRAYYWKLCDRRRDITWPTWSAPKRWRACTKVYIWTRAEERPRPPSPPAPSVGPSRSTAGSTWARRTVEYNLKHRGPSGTDQPGRVSTAAAGRCHLLVSCGYKYIHCCASEGAIVASGGASNRAPQRKGQTLSSRAGLSQVNHRKNIAGPLGLDPPWDLDEIEDFVLTFSNKVSRLWVLSYESIKFRGRIS